MEKYLHEKMEFAWKSMELLRDSLKFKTTDLKCSFGNYVRINDEWNKQNYPVPTFLIEGIGEVGYDYDKFYLVIAVQKSSVSKEFIQNLLKTGYNISIYGDKDFLKQLCITQDPEDVFETVKGHDEEIVQIEFDFSEDGIEDFQKTVEILYDLFMEYKIKIM